ncbi:MAG: LOG family protein [Candidatus Omnitrophica bacterium]|nr:LOG family protein [Candidatus Omnitrophota bacterium]
MEKPYPRKIYSTGNPLLEEQIERLMDSATGHFSERDVMREMMVTAIRLGFDGVERGDMKLMNAAMKELRYAFNVFGPYRHIRKVAIFGSARTPRKNADYQLAKKFATSMVRKGWMVITGASSGIMNAGNEGAGRTHSFGVNIRLPFEQEANPVIANDSKLINFKYFFTRKLIFVRESDATVLFPGGFGTHDEGFETLTLVQTGKATPRPIICIDPPQSQYWSAWREYLVEHLAIRKMIDHEDMDLIHFTHDAEDAARVIARFYKNYHSMRYIHQNLIIRIKRKLTASQLRTINRRFAPILSTGKISQWEKPFEEEDNEPHTHHLIRLVLHFNRRHFARLKLLIDALNHL